MSYISGIHALNLPCSLPTSGDWHRFAIQWERPTNRESSESIFGDYGIENCTAVPGHPGTHKVANHIRALLDMISEGQFGYAQGMRKDFICNDSLDEEIFAKVILLKDSALWSEINRFMGREYTMRWLRFLDSKDIEYPNPRTSPESVFSEALSLDRLIIKKASAFQCHEDLTAFQDLLVISLKDFDLLNDQIKNILSDVLLVNDGSYIEFLAKIWKVPERETKKLLGNYACLQKRLGLRIEDGGNKEIKT